MSRTPVVLALTHNRADLALAGWMLVAVVAWLILLTYMIIYRDRMRGARNRFDAIRRLLGPQRARRFAFGCLLWGALSFILIAVLHPT